LERAEGGKPTRDEEYFYARLKSTDAKGPINSTKQTKKKRKEPCEPIALLRVNPKTKYCQFRVDDIKAVVEAHVTTNKSCRTRGQRDTPLRLVLALSSVDLFSDDKDLFLAGFAYMRVGIAVFSIARYDPLAVYGENYWYEVSRVSARKHGQLWGEGEEGDNCLLRRMCRLFVHEALHLLQFDHCIFHRCCMNGSGHVREDDSQPLTLCPVDMRKLCTLMQRDAVQYQAAVREVIDELKIGDEKSQREIEPIKSRFERGPLNPISKKKEKS